MAVVVLEQFNKHTMYRSDFRNTLSVSKLFISSWHALEQQQQQAENKNLLKHGKMVVHLFCYPVTNTEKVVPSSMCMHKNLKTSQRVR